MRYSIERLKGDVRKGVGKMRCQEDTTTSGGGGRQEGRFTGRAAGGFVLTRHNADHGEKGTR